MFIFLYRPVIGIQTAILY